MGIEEEILSKKGIELFRELLRVYPVAEVEDYYKAGIWKDDVMKVDLQLVEAHRREAGAPDPVPLEEVPMPELPKTGIPVPGLQLPGAVRPPGVPVAAGAVRPAVPTAAVPAKAGTVAATAGGPVAELRLIALFVAKWKLDPTRTKMMLAKMTPQRRRYIIQNFKTTAQGMEATNALEQYIAQCEKTNAWGSATGTTAAAPTTVAPRPAGTVPAGAVASAGVRGPTPAGIKRPLTPTISSNPALDASKRPRIVAGAGSITPKAVAPPSSNPAAAALAARLAAQRPRGPVAAAIRPGTPRPVQSAVRPPMQSGGLTPRVVSPTTARPAAARPAVRPGMGSVAPKAKAGEKPGELIRNLLQRF